MTKVKDNYDLLDWCNEETIIECTKCTEEEKFWGAAEDAIDVFAEKGWRVTAKHCYCPYCAEVCLNPLKK